MSGEKTLEDLKKPFTDNEIGKLPKPTKKQTEDAKAPKWDGIKCKVCGTWHHKDVVHLDFVGHAALTKRLLDVDPTWDWEPMSLIDGLPRFDETGGLWIKLTVLGTTRLGYGNAATSKYKDVGSRFKEVIGDALRNAGMRFGMALDLWHKGDLKLFEDDQEPVKEDKPKIKKKAILPPRPNDYVETWKKWIDQEITLGNSSKVKEHISALPESDKKDTFKEYYNTKIKETK